MNNRQKTIADLLDRLDALESRTPSPDQAPIHAVARQALIDELSRVAHEDWLAVYRSGDSIDAVSYAGWFGPDQASDRRRQRPRAGT